ncbi:MAG: SAF domain-containing protein, partial [Burkholderiaceae bacterium]
SIDIVIDATGSPAAGIQHVLACCEYGKHIVMVNVEADALAGPLLARKAAEAGIVYSLAYGDQPALICEMVDWARASGFEVIAAGKGTKYLSSYHQSTPATVWSHYGISESDASDGLQFPPCGVDDLARVLRPRSSGGVLAHRGQVEVISSLERDERPVFRDLRWGVYVTMAGDSEYVRRCFKEYGLVTDPSGEFTSMYKPFHLIGLELGISIASVGLRAEPTGAPIAWHADVVATAKRDLKVGERLDGEGGFTVYGRLMPASDSLRLGGLPLGLAHGIKLKRAVQAGVPLRWSDVQIDTSEPSVRFRKSMEDSFAKEVNGA